MKVRALAAALASCLPLGTSAVYLNADGTGQALIYPYYTAQSASGNAFNTYLSVVNHTSAAKALRVRFREGRNAAEVGSFNLFLSPNDVWTGAVVPSLSGGGVLVTRDRPCIEGAFSIDFAPGAVPTLEFRNTLYAGANSDGGGDGLDRTREGYVEILEMAVLTGGTAGAVTHNSAGVPTGCSAVQNGQAINVAAPTGGLSGTLTLINVASGLDFTVNAEALAELATQPYYRLPADSYPDFNAAEVTPTSVVAANGFVYRSNWTRGVDAVSAVLMRSSALAEFILDAGTHSGTDVVTTFPTWRHYVTTTGATAPFAVPFAWPAVCAAVQGASGPVAISSPTIEVFTRHGAQTLLAVDDFGVRPPDTPNCSAAATVYDFMLGDSGQAVNPPRSPVLGSFNRKFATGPWAAGTRENGWIRIGFASAPSIQSLATSTRIDSATGASVSGVHRFRGLPTVGFFARTFANGTLSCGTASCQGNYGGAFPLHFMRTIEQGN